MTSPVISRAQLTDLRLLASCSEPACLSPPAVRPYAPKRNQGVLFPVGENSFSRYPLLGAGGGAKGQIRTAAASQIPLEAVSWGANQTNKEAERMLGMLVVVTKSRQSAVECGVAPIYLGDRNGGH